MSEEQVAEVSGSPEVAQSVEQSTMTDDWRAMIPDDVRGHSSLQHITDVGALAKSYVHAQQMIGADKVVIPSKHSSQEDWDHVYHRLGRPEAPEMYELEVSPDLRQDGGLDWYEQIAHVAWLNSNQAQKIFDAYNQYADSIVQESQVDVEAFRAQTEMELRREYGQAFDDKIDVAMKVLDQFGATELAETQLPDGTMLGDHPDVVRLFAEIGTYISEKVGEDSLVGVKTGGGMTPDEARMQLAEIHRKDSPFWDNRHPDHDAFVQRALRLQEAIHG
mgnify:FL=1